MAVHRTLTSLAYLPFVLVALYVVLLGLLTVPALQKEVLFLHRIRIPFFVDYDTPSKYGLAPYKTRNLYLNTTDGETLGVWHILPRKAYLGRAGDAPLTSLPEQAFEVSMRDRPTVIYFHGNAGTRATSHRVRGYSALSSVLDVNVIAVDYRGFGDSTGSPSEEGLLVDARTVYDYVSTTWSVGNGGHPSRQIVLAGQSLGTGVVAALAGSLASEGIHPRALIMIAPFASIPSLLLEYNLFWVIPLLSPLKAFPRLQQWLLSTMRYKFDSAIALSATKSPTLLLHSIDDDIIPHSHSRTLFHHVYQATRAKSGSTLDTYERIYSNWGKERWFDRPDGGPVIWWEGLSGGHNNIGWAEGTIDLIGRIAQLGT